MNRLIKVRGRLIEWLSQRLSPRWERQLQQRWLRVSGEVGPPWWWTWGATYGFVLIMVLGYYAYRFSGWWALLVFPVGLINGTAASMAGNAWKRAHEAYQQGQRREMDRVTNIIIETARSGGTPQQALQNYLDAIRMELDHMEGPRRAVSRETDG